MENVLILAALVKETFAYVLPTELNLTVSLLWDGLMGLNNWIGYAIAAVYYIGTDYDFGLTFCEVMGYGYYVIDGLNYIVAFADVVPTDQLAGLAEAAVSGDMDALTDAAMNMAGDIAANSGDIIAAGEEIIAEVSGEAGAEAEAAS